MSNYLDISKISIDFPTPEGPFRALDELSLRIKKGEFDRSRSGLEILIRLGKLAKKAMSSSVHDQRGPINSTPGLFTQVGELRHQRRR